MATTNPLLEVDDLTVRFGGLTAVNHVSFNVGDGELVGIIGPNGAGKTTAFNAIAGAVQPTSGQIRLGARTVSGLPPEKVARSGIARTFQSVRLFKSMTVEENVRLGAIAVSPSMSAAADRGNTVIRTLNMEALRDSTVSMLPLADQKRVEIARGLALSPKLLLLDEMMSGLNQDETQEIIDIIRQLNAEGLTIVVIEHVLKVIMDLSHRLLVLDQGELIAEGAPRTVMKDPGVVEAYLGRGAAQRLASEQ